MRLAGQAALVTGAASGLGYATARALAEGGARVTLLDADGPRLARAAGEIGGLGLACDVTDSSGMETALALARAAHGPARILVNCAGIAPAEKLVGRNGPMKLESFRRVVEVNLIGSLNLIRLFAAEAVRLESLDEGERGVIVNTASIAAYEGQVGHAAYAASKAAVVGMTLPIARELAPSGIRVCTIAPGIFETPMIAAMPQPVRDSMAGTVPFPSRFGQAVEFAALVLHVVSNVMLNGETIRLDGALRMGPR